MTVTCVTSARYAAKRRHMDRRDYVWFAAQLMLFVAALAAPIVQRSPVHPLVRVLGIGMLGAGGTIAAAAYRALGASHSPWSTPLEGGRLVTSGIYRRVRHPIYLGWCLASVGGALLSGSLLGLAVAAALTTFYDRRARAEERLLAARYAAYPDYVRSSSRFVPSIY
jgi:protein-S-isoprenylcysteine O-methyltransferase Ste14